jgi:BirA family biotin operon repressor/biotin-[acetyl-CoA-carboxylase] ligase
VALTQEAGRGRQGRSWQSREGNFFGSTLILLKAGDPPATTLSLAAGLALIDAVDKVSAGASLKWPNDVLRHGAKLAGILLERSGDRIVAGLGVNLSSAPEVPGRATTSLEGAILPKAFAPLLAACFARRLDQWRNHPADQLIANWIDRAHPLGTQLTVHSGGGEIVSGRFAGLELDGALRLETESGQQTIRAGDVEL